MGNVGRVKNPPPWKTQIEATQNLGTEKRLELGQVRLDGNAYWGMEMKNIEQCLNFWFTKLKDTRYKWIGYSVKDTSIVHKNTKGTTHSGMKCNDPFNLY